MGSKKRGSSSAEGEEVVDKQVNTSTDDKVILEHSKKKLKKGKRNEKESATEIENDFGAPSTSHKTTSVQPMERKKQRKTRDKERHRAEAEGDEPKQMDVELKENHTINKTELTSGSDSGGSSMLPEFHIGVFKDLASADASVREAAAEVLVTELQEVQKAYDKLENKEVVQGSLKLEAEKDDGLDNCAPSVRYAVRRLIRGVSSSRECARQGFALGLTLLVGAVPNIKVNSLLKLIVNLLEITSSMKGQEARDCLLGRLFAYGALARSGRLTKGLDLNENSTNIKEFISALISLASKKRYLQEPAVSVILELVEKLPVEIILVQVLEAPGVHDWFDSSIELGNPDALLLALKVQEKIGIDHRAFSKLLPSDYSPNKLFTSDHLSSIANCLKESTFCQPRVHSIWPNLISLLLPDVVSRDVDSASSIQGIKKHKRNRKGSSLEEDIDRNLRSFCDTIIEGSLLTSSHDRKHLAFDILLLLLPNLPASCVEIVLSYKLIQCLMDILSTKDSWLYKVAQYFMKELSEWVKNDDIRRVAVIVALQKHSSGKFDCITRTKTVKNLMSEFKTESGCTLFIQSLISMFLDEGQASEEPSDQSQTTDDNSEMGSAEDKDSFGPTGFADFLKSWVVDSIQCVLKHSKLDPESRFQVQKEILKFLAVQGLFCSSLGTEVTSFELEEKFRWPKSAISSDLRRMCIEQLELLLANAQKVEGHHALPGGFDSNDLGSYFIRLIGTLCNIPTVTLFRVLSDDDDKSFKKLQAMEAQLSREERNCGLSMDASKFRALRYLLIQLLLQILLRPGEFSEAAAELIICCKRAFGSSDLLDSGEDEPSGDGMPDFIDVLEDTMLSLLPQSSAPLRSAIEQVFKCFCTDITEDGLVRMLRVIKKDLKPSRHHEAGSDDEDGDEDDLLGIEEAEESDEAETHETAESDEQTDDSEAVSGIEAMSTELPEASDDDSDSGMDDDAMFRMDTYLARIFKERKNQAGGETAQSQLVLFKLRVLSLLEIYLHENPGKPQVLKVLSNLAQAFVNPHTTEGSEQLAQRIWGILQKKIFKAKDYPKGESVQLSILETLLEKNLKLAAKPFKKKKSTSNTSSKKQSARNRHKMITSLAQNSTFWILKVIDARNFSLCDLAKVFEIFKGVLVSYFDSKKSQMKSEFLKEILRRRPWIGRNLLGFLLEKCASAKLQFRQVEALDLISEVLKSIAAANADKDGSDPTKMFKKHLPLLCQLIKQLVLNVPEKQSRRADVRKFCGKLFQILMSLNLSSSFLKELEPDARTGCEAQLGDAFLALEKQER